MMIFSSIGLVLVTLGVYSVLAYTTARRTQEIGYAWRWERKARMFWDW